MNQCTAVALLPPPEFVLRLAALGGGSRPEAGHLLCELAWCGAMDLLGEDACGLFAGHPSTHDWSIVDPTVVAVDAVIARNHPHLAPRDGL